VRAERFGGAGNGILETNEFREWSGGEGPADKAVLFCFGDPEWARRILGKWRDCFKGAQLMAGNFSSLAIDSLCNQARTEDLAEIKHPFCIGQALYSNNEQLVLKFHGIRWWSAVVVCVLPVDIVGWWSCSFSNK